MYLPNIINRADKSAVQPENAAFNEIFHKFFGKQSWFHFLFQKNTNIVSI